MLRQFAVGLRDNASRSRKSDRAVAGGAEVEGDDDWLAFHGSALRMWL
jgi:hypothetical protein